MPRSKYISSHPRMIIILLFAGGKVVVRHALLHQVFCEQAFAGRHEGRLPQLQDLKIQTQFL